MAQDRTAAETAQPLVQAALAAKMTADFRSAIADKPLRAALQSVADTVGFNLWFDRSIDPSQLASSDPTSSTPYQTVASLAKSANVQVFVIENLVLVGRPNTLAALVEQIRQRESNAAVIDVQWPDLTTPTEAWALIAGSSARELPHDLWPATNWKQIDPALAQALVLAQFQGAPSGVEPTTQAANAQGGKWSRHYPLGAHAKALRTQVMTHDPTATIREAGGALLVTTTTVAHQAAVDAWLSTPAAKSPGLNVDTVKFSLKLQNTPAVKVFTQLAATSGRQLQITPEAQEACQRPVNLDAVDLSLRELSERVAAVAGVTIQWIDQTLQVSVMP